MNPAHPIIKKLNDLRETNPQLAILVTEQLFANAMVCISLAFHQWNNVDYLFSVGFCRFSGGPQDHVEINELSS